MRSGIASFFILLLFFVCPIAMSQETDSKTFVLVHGGWVGEFAWEPVAAVLRDNGHEVYNVSLKGQGSRMAEHSADITLEDHVADVLTVLTENDLTNVYLVGHSGGGKVVTATWDRSRNRIHHAIFVDGFAPVREGRSPLYPVEQRDIEELGYQGSFDDPKAMVHNKNLESLMPERIVPMSLGLLMANVELAEPLPEDTHRSYVIAGNNPNRNFQRYYDAVNQPNSGWITYQLPTGHGVMGQRPNVLATILMTSK